MRGFRPSRLSGDSEEHQRLMIEFREQRVREYQEKVDDGEGIFEPAPQRTNRHSPHREKGMDYIRYRCRRCNSLLESPTELAGQEETCPICGYVTPIPSRPCRKQTAQSKAADVSDVSNDNDQAITEFQKQLDVLSQPSETASKARSREPNW